jgi:ferredoxin
MAKCRISAACIGCGACQDECPLKAIADGDIFEVDRDRCDGCGTCVDICPVDACVID